METVQDNLIDFKKIFAAKVPKLVRYIPNWLFRRVQRLLHEEDINEILTKYRDLEGLDFVNATVDDFNLKIVVNGIENLAEDQRIIVASNHPLGGLDGLALIGTVGKVHPDVGTPVNDFLMFVKNLKPIFIPVNKVGTSVEAKADNVRVFNEAFESDKAICYFPFGLCSRKTKDGEILDLDWKKTFVSKAKAYHRDIIPAHIDGRNTDFFYNMARLRKQLHIKANIEMAFLVDEFFKQRNKTLTITFGKPIPWQTFDKRYSDAQWAMKLRNFSYQLNEDPNQSFDPAKDYKI
jgi:hypothetical protein